MIGSIGLSNAIFNNEAEGNVQQIYWVGCILLETIPKKSEKMLSKNLLETKSIIFSELFNITDARPRIL